MTPAAVLAVDGGNTKTDVALVAADGSVLAYTRGPGSCHQNIGIDATMGVLDDLVRAVAARAGCAPDPVARHAAVFLAGADLPVEVAMLRDRVGRAGWAPDADVDNDSVAVLRTGSDAADRVAVVCGAGINCVGAAANGATLRFPSLGTVSGDWGGGAQLGMEALHLAARAEDGRGAPTALAAAVCEHFGRSSVADVSAGLHLGEIPSVRTHELVPVLLRVAGGGDEVAASVVARMGHEVALLATVALRRLGLVDRPADVVLGGGVLAARDPLLLGTVTGRLQEAAPHAVVRVVDDPPVVGAGLIGLEALGAATPAAQARLRRGPWVPGGRPAG